MSEEREVRATFDRDPDGTIRLRIRFTPELADLIEQAANGQDLVTWIMTAIEDVARGDIEAARERTGGAAQAG